MLGPPQLHPRFGSLPQALLQFQSRRPHSPFQGTIPRQSIPGYLQIWERLLHSKAGRGDDRRLPGPEALEAIRQALQRMPQAPDLQGTSAAKVRPGHREPTVSHQANCTLQTERDGQSLLAIRHSAPLAITSADQVPRTCTTSEFTPRSDSLGKRRTPADGLIEGLVDRPRDNAIGPDGSHVRAQCRHGQNRDCREPKGAQPSAWREDSLSNSPFRRKCGHWPAPVAPSPGGCRAPSRHSTRLPEVGGLNQPPNRGVDVARCQPKYGGIKAEEAAEYPRQRRVHWRLKVDDGHRNVQSALTNVAVRRSTG